MRDETRDLTDGERLRLRFEALKREHGINKAVFARTYKVPGGASMISQHMSGNRPISLEAASAYVAGFGCTLADISPTLAAKLPREKLGENFPPNSPNSASNMPLAQVGRAQAAINVVANEAQAVDIISAAMDMMTDAQRKEMSAKLAAWALAPDSAKLKKSVSESLTSATKSEPSKDD